MDNNLDHLDQADPWSLNQSAIENIIRFKALQEAAADVQAVLEEFCIDETPDKPEDDFPTWNLNESEIMNIIRIRKAQEKLQGDTQ